MIAVDIKQDRLEVARRLGADQTLSPAECDVAAELMKQTEGRGVDVAMEVVGFPATVETATKAVRKGGSVGLVGNLTPAVELPLQAVVTRELSLFGSCASRGEYATCLDLIAGGAIEVAPLLSGVSSLEEASQWFSRLQAGQENLIKVIVQP